MIGNYTGGGSGPTFFHITSSNTLAVGRMIIHAEWTGPSVAEDYGDISGGLPTGIIVQLREADDTVTVDLTDGVPVTSDADWSREAYEYYQTDNAAGDNFFTASLDFGLDFGREGMLRLLAGQKLGLLLEDNFSTLVTHYCKVTGFVESST